MNTQNFKIKIYSLTVLFLIASMALTSCKKDNSGSGKLAYKLGVANSGTQKTSSAVSSVGGTTGTIVVVTPSNITWKTGYAYISEIEFEALKAETPVKYESKGLRKVDIFNSATTLFDDVTLAPGLYDQIHLEITIGNTSTTKEPGIFLTGTYGNTPIEFAYDESQDAFGLTVEGDAFTFDSSKNYSAMITLHLNLLLSGISNTELDAATKNSNGIIVINSTTNKSIYQKAKQNVQNLSDVNFNH